MNASTRFIALVATITLFCSACANHQPIADQVKQHDVINEPIIAEAWMSESNIKDNIDSVATWTDANGRVRVYATAKKGDAIRIYDGNTGKTLGSLGSSGKQMGQLSRPNGLFITNDLLFVVERDNRRVQVFDLANGARSLGAFGTKELTKPYGLYVQKHADAGYHVFVTDSFMAGEDAKGEDILPNDADLNRRVRQYRVVRNGQTITATLAHTFGATEGDGRLRVVESVYGDPSHGRLLIAEESMDHHSGLRGYDFSGEYTGPSIGKNIYRHQAEGIALVACNDGSGYWIASDQDADDQRFLIFDRLSLQHLGSFRPQGTRETDGVWFHAAAQPNFPHGVLYTQHDNQAVSAFDWQVITDTLGLKRCRSGV